MDTNRKGGIVSDSSASRSTGLPKSIADAAAEWVVRRDAGPLSAEDERAFEVWLAKPEHRIAFEKLDSLWSLLDEEPVAATALPPIPPIRRSTRRGGRNARPLRPRKPRRWLGPAIAASLALVLFGAAQDWPMQWRADYSTGVGERRIVTLEDGSSVMLDGSSAISLDFTEKRRVVRLLEGSAQFTVTANPSRPFTVEAAGGSATALGTVFAVRAGDGTAELVVTEHRVQARGNGRSAIVGEGQRIDFGAGGLTRIEAARSGDTAWTRGRLVVVNQPLDKVVAEIARHRRGYLAVTGAASAMKVSGVYDLDHPLAAIDSIERSLGLRSFRLSNRLIVLHR